jgi:hypothetical protein
VSETHTKLRAALFWTSFRSIGTRPPMECENATRARRPVWAFVDDFGTHKSYIIVVCIFGALFRVSILFIYIIVILRRHVLLLFLFVVDTTFPILEKQNYVHF